MSKNLFDLAGKVAIVTGGNTGIGRAIAVGLAEAGATVAILARNEERNAETLRELKVINRTALAVQIDLLDHDHVQSTVQRLEEELGPPAILVNNAAIISGGGPIGGVLRVRENNDYVQRWSRVLETNLTAAQYLTGLVAPSMVERRSGKIINVLAYRNVAYPAQAWMASKAGLAELTREWAAELGPHNVHVNGLAPGWIETQMTAASATAPRVQRWVDRTPLGRTGQPEDFVGAAVYLASAASDFVTGCIIPVDGGFSINLVTSP